MPKFVPRQRKHKVLARQKRDETGHSSVPTKDTNVAQIALPSKNEKEEKRQKLREELRSQQPKISAKKQKRLDKYIENKLRKDETLDLVRKLEKEKDKWNASGLTSSKNLRKRGFEEFVNGQVGAAAGHEIIETERDVSKGMRDEVSEDDVASEDSFEANHRNGVSGNSVGESDEAWATKRAAPIQGSGLAQPLQLGPNGLPVIPFKAGAKKPRRLGEPSPYTEIEPMMQDSPWEGFDSSESGEEEEQMYNLSEDESATDTDSAGSQDESDKSGDDSDSDESQVESETGSDTSMSGVLTENDKLKPRTSAFKSWAIQQLNQSIGHTPSYATNGQLEPPRVVGQNPPASIKSTATEGLKLVNGLPEVRAPTVSRKIYSVSIDRPEHIRESRTQLPVLQKEQEIMEAIHANSVIVLKADTGSGKTTQIPQFLLEAGYAHPSGPTPGMIGITQPRRVAAVSMAKRVSEELGEHGKKVAHQIRFDSTVSSETAIKFMTDGILLRELSQDLLLKKYSAIIIDEAHERSVNTDLLIGMLSKIVPARMRKDKFNPDPQPLKLIIMSATLNVGDFLHEKLFSPSLRPPIVEAEGRQHRVTTHFALRSRADYLEEVIEKVKRAHRKLPKGGVLVFLTGQNEIKQVQSRLRQELVTSARLSETASHSSKMHVAASETPLEVEDIDFGSTNAGKKTSIEDEYEVNILTQSDEEAEDQEFEISDDEDRVNDTTSGGATSEVKKKDFYDTVHILPLYSQLPTKEQLRVFEPPPDRSRMIVLATNVAETSLTIPGIRYVFDCGRSKERKHNLDTGVQSFEIDYISKASAQQRAGRAGRTGPGHCWRLYTSALYEQFFPDHSEPEIIQAPAESIVLQIKGFAYPKPVAEFPFPTAPALQTLNKAEKLLKNLGALTSTGQMTGLGRELSIYPLSPRLGKIIATAVEGQDALRYAIYLVAGLAVGDIYINNIVGERNDDDGELDDLNDLRKQRYGRVQAALTKHDKMSDAVKLLTAISMYLEAMDKEEFCAQNFVKPKAMMEISQLVEQLKSIVSANRPSALPFLTTSSKLKLSTALIKLINTTAASGYIDQVAVRWDCHPSPPVLLSKPRRAIDIPYIPLVPLNASTPASTDLLQHAIFIHPSSVLSRLPTKDTPQYIIYQHLQKSQSRTVGAESDIKTRMFPLTPIDAASLARLARNSALIEYGKPVPKTKIEDVSGAPKRRVCWVTTEIRGSGAGRYGWPLPPTKVRQVMDVKSSTGWRVEEVLS